MSKRSPARSALVVTYALSAAASAAHADPPNNARCPAAAPQENTPCATPSLECGYRPCGDYNTIRATCDARTRRWSIVEVTCNPPPPPPLSTR